MKKIAFHIQKGGVGKTTISGNVAYQIAKQNNKKVAIIDCDSQGNLTSWLIPDEIEFKNDISGVLTGSCTVEESLVKIDENLYVIPSFSIGSKLSTTAEIILAQEPYIFDDLCEALEKMNFDIAIFDLSPGMNRLERSIILAMDEVITPVTPEKFSVDGIQIFAFELQKLNKNYKRNVAHNKLVVNSMNKSFKRHLIANSEFKKLEYEIFEIGQDSKIAEAIFANKSILEYYPESKTVPEIKRLGEAILWQ